MNGTQYSKKTSNNETEAMKLVSQKMQEISSFQGDPPEPEILLEILKKKTDFANVWSIYFLKNTNKLELTVRIAHKLETIKLK